MASVAGRWRLPAVLALCAAVLSGCALFTEQVRPDREGLSGSVTAFFQVLRWGDYQKAAVFVAPEGAEGFWRAAEALDGRVRLTEVQVRHVGGAEGDMSREALVLVRSYRLNEATIKAATLRQRWVYDREARAWRVAETDLGRLAGP